MERIIFHIDVNSAFLSWSAVYKTRVLGEEQDLREIPSAVCGDKEARHGIILAKSIPAKKFGVKTGEPIFRAISKCPDLVLVPPDFKLYSAASKKFVSILKEFAPVVEQFSIDEAWADMSGTEIMYGSPVEAAYKLKKKIFDELGFTVNIGISTNKFLAKTAGDFEKPDKVHTLFPEEIEKKLWPLPVRDMFYIGPATERRLNAIGIKTIGELAKTDPDILKWHLYKQGEVLWNLANGRNAELVTQEHPMNKSYGKSMTTPFDITDTATAHRLMLLLCEAVGVRMRKDGQASSCIYVNIRSNEFADRSQEISLQSPTDVTGEIYYTACRIFDALWDKKTPLRQIGVSAGKMSPMGYRQANLFDGNKYIKGAKIDTTVDTIRKKYGEEAILRACFLNSCFKPGAPGFPKSAEIN